MNGDHAAGVLASEVPSMYTRRAPDGSLLVDYNSLLSGPWARDRRNCGAVSEPRDVVYPASHLAHRLDVLERTRSEEERTNDEPNAV